MIDQRKVYYYSRSVREKYNGLAMDCHLHQQDDEDEKELWFFDSIHPHMVEGEIVRETADGFVFRSDGVFPGEWTFKELTIEEFRRWVYKHVELGEVIATKVHTTADLHEWYRKKFGFPFE